MVCRYMPLDPALLPSLLVVVANAPSDSGRVHSDVRDRWKQGDPAVHQGMAAIAKLAVEGRQAPWTRVRYPSPAHHKCSLSIGSTGSCVLGCKTPVQGVTALARTDDLVTAYGRSTVRKSIVL